MTAGTTMQRNIHCQAASPRASSLLASTGGLSGLSRASTSLGVRLMMTWFTNWVAKMPTTMASWNSEDS